MLHDFKITYQGITLRPLEANDIELLRQTRNKNRSAFLNSGYISPSGQSTWYARYEHAENDYVFAACFTDNLDSIIGFSALYDVDEKQSKAEFGRFLLVESYRGKGFGAKVVKATCAIGWSFLNLDEINLEVLESNISARKTYLRSGFHICSKCCRNGSVVYQMKAIKENCMSCENEQRNFE